MLELNFQKVSKNLIDEIRKQITDETSQIMTYRTIASISKKLFRCDIDLCDLQVILIELEKNEELRLEYVDLSRGFIPDNFFVVVLMKGNRDQKLIKSESSRVVFHIKDQIQKLDDSDIICQKKLDKLQQNMQKTINLKTSTPAKDMMKTYQRNLLVLYRQLETRLKQNFAKKMNLQQALDSILDKIQQVELIATFDITSKFSKELGSAISLESAETTLETLSQDIQLGQELDNLIANELSIMQQTPDVENEIQKIVADLEPIAVKVKQDEDISGPLINTEKDLEDLFESIRNNNLLDNNETENQPTSLINESQ